MGEFHSPVCRVFKMSHVCRVTAELYLMICSAPEEVQTCGGPQVAPRGSSSYRKEPQISTQPRNLYTIRSPGRAAPTLWCIRLSIQLLARWREGGDAWKCEDRVWEWQRRCRNVRILVSWRGWQWMDTNRSVRGGGARGIASSLLTLMYDFSKK